MSLKVSDSESRGKGINLRNTEEIEKREFLLKQHVSCTLAAGSALG